MSVDTSVKKLREDLAAQIKSFGEKRITNKRRALWLKMLATTFSVLTTILLGLKGFEYLTESSLLFKNLPLVLSALVTLVSSFDGFFNHRALWVRYTLTVSNLRAIQDDLDYATADANAPPTQVRVDGLLKKYQNVLSETNTSWQTLRDD
jgi:hypothetical protein